MTTSRSLKDFSDKVSLIEKKKSNLTGSCAGVEMAEALEELNVSLDEMHVAEEELRVQNEELAAAREAVEVERLRYQDLFDSAPDCYLVTDRSGIITESNVAASRLLAVPLNGLKGKPMPLYISSALRAEFRTRIERLGRGDETASWETEILSGRGDRSPVAASVTVQREPGGAVKELRWMLHDITELRKHEEQLRAAKDEAEAGARTKAEFLANMSHEIRTPLNAVIGLTGLLLDTELDAEQRDFLETIRSSGDALLAVINDILDFSRLERERTALEKQPFDLRRLVAESVDLVAQEAARKGLKLSSFIERDGPIIIVGDPTRLRQVLLNLLNNAVKFTDRGEVSLAVSCESTKDGPEVHFRIRDTGIGISEEDIPRLFSSFSRVDNSLNRRFGGTGLGLAISKRLVEMMGGRIWVESEPGRGTIFHFTLKASSKPQAGVRWQRAGSEPKAMAAPVSPLKILLAEDNAANQKTELLMLRKLGYTADLASTGREVLQALEREAYDVVLMDLQMPKMDGLEAARMIRQRWPEGGPYIIAVTAYALSGDRGKCLDAGMEDYISKPIRMDDLREAMARVPKVERPESEH